MNKNKIIAELSKLKQQSDDEYICKIIQKAIQEVENLKRCEEEQLIRKFFIKN